MSQEEIQKCPRCERPLVSVGDDKRYLECTCGYRFDAFLSREDMEPLSIMQPNAPPEEMNAKEAAEAVMGEYDFVTLADRKNHEILVYQDGVYTNGGEATIEAWVEEHVVQTPLPRSTEPRAPTSHFVNEVIGHVQRSTFKPREIFDENPSKVNLQNGIYDLTNGQFIPHDPRYYFMAKLPLIYDPKATCPEFLKYLKKVQPDAVDRRRLLDHLASLLDRRPKKRKALMNVGPIDTGKTTFENVAAAFVGGKNASHVSLADLCGGNDRFAASQLYQKFLNAHDELPDITIKYTGGFKVLTGGGWYEAQFKGRTRFDFMPFAKHFFACNKLPKITDTADLAFFGRWDIVFWEVQLSAQEKDRDLIDKLTTQRELSGLLNICLALAKSQIERGHPLIEPSAEETRDIWMEKTEPVRNFLKAKVVRALNESVVRADLYSSWEGFRQEMGYSHGYVSKTKFNELVEEITGAQKIQKKVLGKNRDVWAGIRMVGDVGTFFTSFLDNGRGVEERVGAQKLPTSPTQIMLETAKS